MPWRDHSRERDRPWERRASTFCSRPVASRSEGYHIALAVATAFASVAIEPARQLGFLISFLARWGETLERASRAGEATTPQSARPGTLR